MEYQPDPYDFHSDSEDGALFRRRAQVQPSSPVLYRLTPVMQTSWTPPDSPSLTYSQSPPLSPAPSSEGTLQLNLSMSTCSSPVHSPGPVPCLTVPHQPLGPTPPATPTSQQDWHSVFQLERQRHTQERRLREQAQIRVQELEAKLEELQLRHKACDVTIKEEKQKAETVNARVGKVT